MRLTSTQRFRVRAGRPSWPTGKSLALVVDRGGIKKLTDEERASLELRRPHHGEEVDDVPLASVEWLVEQGYIEPVTAAPASLPDREDEHDG